MSPPRPSSSSGLDGAVERFHPTSFPHRRGDGFLADDARDGDHAAVIVSASRCAVVTICTMSS